MLIIIYKNVFEWEKGRRQKVVVIGEEGGGGFKTIKLD